MKRRKNFISGGRDFDEEIYWQLNIQVSFNASVRAGGGLSSRQTGGKDLLGERDVLEG